MKSLHFFLTSSIILLMFGACSKPTNTLFRSSASAESGIDFSNTLTPTDSLNIIEYLYYYNGGGVAVGDINNDGKPDIYLSSNQQSNKLFLNTGHLNFKNITASSGTSTLPHTTGAKWNTGVSMADVNGDGWLDIYVCQVGDYKSIKGRNLLYINNHDLTFTERAADFGLDIQSFSTQAAWLDYDRDGDLDMYLLCHSVHSTDMYKDTSVRRVVDPLRGDRLMRNDDGIFHNVSEAAGILSSPIGYGLGVAVSDFNNDAWPDILIGNDFHENDYLYINDQHGGFRQSQNASFRHTSTFSMGCDIADMNRDGRMDLISLDMKPDDEIVLKNSVGADPYDIYQYKVSFGYHYQYPRNTFQLNQYIDQAGTPFFSEVGQQLGISRTDWSWSPLLADFDNNGLTDIFIANGIAHRPNDLDYLKYYSSIQKLDTAHADALINRMPDGRAKNFFFSQSAGLQFDDVSAAWNPEGKDLSTAAAYADFDNDGDLDIIINRIDQPATLLVNQSTGNHYLKVQLFDTSRNKYDIGARITVYAAGQVYARDIYPTRGFQSSSDYTVHIGLGTADHIDSLLIRWPEGTYSLKENVPIDSLLKFTRPKSRSMAKSDMTLTALLTPIYNGLDFIHRENSYNDFEREKLLLYKLSSQGPGIAVGDINGDGREDLWIGGARDQSGITYLQSATGQLLPLQQHDLEAHAGFEDISGRWIDVDADRDLDLVVISGGYQIDNPNILLDRVYFNDGHGNLTYDAAAMPAVSHMSSCIAPNDMDGDGDVDLFIGGRVAPYYGYNTDSYLLINDGKGHFSIDPDPIFKGLGMVTDAVWSAVDNSPRKDLVVCGEWMPITLLSHDGSRWSKRTIPNTEGLWQSISSVDLDGDGDEDLVAGNIGHNHDLRATAAHPARMYVADFDQNTTPEAVISYYVQNQDYSFFSKDELAGEMVILKKKYTDYHSFAQSRLDQVFVDLEKNPINKSVSQLASTIFENNGKGQYTAHPLPFSAQSTMIFSILPTDVNGDNLTDLMLGGNIYEVTPSFGRMDGGYGTVLINKGKMQFEELPTDQSGFFVPGAIRDIQTITISGKKAYLVTRNGDRVMVFE